MKKIIEWVKNNKLTSALILVVLYFVFSRGAFYRLGTMGMPSRYTSNYYESAVDMSSPVSTPEIGISTFGKGSEGSTSLATKQSSSIDENSDRMVSKKASMSLLVSDVRKTVNSIETKTNEFGGFVVDMTVNNPYERQNGNVSVRIPTEKLDTMLEFLRGVSVRVSSERVYQSDITDQYTDVQERLNTLNRTKSTFEGILASATEVEDILEVQRQILYIQDQIDSLKGREKYLEQINDTSLINISLSTDELELPYAPENPWRPKVVFKYATRSLVSTFRSLGGMGIWIGVYAAIWVPALVVVLLVRKAIKRKKTNQASSQK